MVRQSPAAPPAGDLSFPIGPRGVWGSGPQALLGQGRGLSPEWARLASHGLTYCVALAVGGRLGLSAIVKRGVHPAPLIGGLQGGWAGGQHVQEGRRRRAGCEEAREATGRKEGRNRNKRGGPPTWDEWAAQPPCPLPDRTCPNLDGPWAWWGGGRASGAEWPERGRGRGWQREAARGSRQSRHSRRGRRAGLSLLCCPPTPGPLTSALAWQHPSFRPAYHWGLPAGAAPWGPTAGGSWVVRAQGGAHFLPRNTQTCSGTKAGAPQRASSRGLSAPCLGHRDAFLGRGTGRVGIGHQGAPGSGRGRLIFLQPCLGTGPRLGSTRGRMYTSPAPLALPRSALTTRALLGLAAPLGFPSHLLVFPLSPHCTPAFNTPQPVTSTPARAHTCPSHTPCLMAPKPTTAPQTQPSLARLGGSSATSLCPPAPWGLPVPGTYTAPASTPAPPDFPHSSQATMVPTWTQKAQEGCVPTWAGSHKGTQRQGSRVRPSVGPARAFRGSQSHRTHVWPCGSPRRRYRPVCGHSRC